MVPRFSALPDWVETNSFYEQMSARIDKLSTLSKNQAASKGGVIGSKRVKLSKLFDVDYGHSLELNSLVKCDDGINFVSRTSENNGVSARVKLIDGLAPTEAGVLTVAGSGSVLETFLQTEPFYSGYHLFCLRPKEQMSLEQKLFYCICIRANKYRYNYGRQANKTLSDLLIPDISQIPAWVGKAQGAIIKEWSHAEDAQQGASL